MKYAAKKCMCGDVVGVHVESAVKVMNHQGLTYGKFRYMITEQKIGCNGIKLSNYMVAIYKWQALWQIPLAAKSIRISENVSGANVT